MGGHKVKEQYERKSQQPMKQGNEEWRVALFYKLGGVRKDGIIFWVCFLGKGEPMDYLWVGSHLTSIPWTNNIFLS